jgi:RNA polymerase sigma-70 factor (ECF subfamily)
LLLEEPELSRPVSTTARATRSGDHAVVEFPGTSNDVAIVAAVRAGRAHGGRLLFDRYGQHVQRVLARVLGPDPDLYDLVQEVFVIALGSIDRLEDPNALRSWLTRITVFTARGRIRRRVRWRFIRFLGFDELPDLPAPEVDVDVSEALAATYRVLDRLAPDERIAFALRFVDGMELSDVARACRVSLATIKRRLGRAHQHFMVLSRDEPALSEWLQGGG